MCGSSEDYTSQFKHHLQREENNCFYVAFPKHMYADIKKAIFGHCSSLLFKLIFKMKVSWLDDIK